MKKNSISRIAVIIVTALLTLTASNTFAGNNLQPVNLWLADHIKEGKKELNFSEFSTYRIGKQYRKLESIAGEVEEGGMPIASYTVLHSKAKLNDVEKKLIINWAEDLRKTIESANPPDSLKRPQRPSAGK